MLPLKYIVCIVKIGNMQLPWRAQRCENCLPLTAVSERDLSLVTWGGLPHS